MLLNQLQRDSELPLLMAADFERGLSMRLNGGTVFPHAMAFGAAGKPEYAEAFGTHHWGRSSRHRHSLELVSRRRCELQSREPDHQYARVQRRSAAGR